MKALKLILIILAFLIGLSAFSQARLQLNVITVSDTSPKIGDVVTVFANLQNIDSSQTFSGVVTFGAANNSQIFTGANILSSPPYSGTQIQLLPKEKIPALFDIEIDQQYFKVGPDIIVIWPIFQHPANDSIFIPINIQLPTGIGEVAANKWTCTAHNDVLQIRVARSTRLLKQVRIFATNGTVIVTQESTENSLDITTQALSQGLYLCELLFQNGERKVLKFIKS
jgi:hypothetical protein